MKKIILISLIVFCPLIVFAEEKIYSLADFPNDKYARLYFDDVGKEFVAKKDNACLIKKFGLIYNGERFFQEVAPFLKTNDVNSCTKEKCDRKVLKSNQKFKVENIVSAADKPTTAPLRKHLEIPMAEMAEMAESTLSASELAQENCPNKLYLCYYKLRFEDGDVAYMPVLMFSRTSSVTTALIDSYPPLMQIYKAKEEKSNARKFSKIGIALGFTESDVLNSNWHKPKSKIESSSNNLSVSLWTWDDGSMVDFENGCVTQITNVTN